MGVIDRAASVVAHRSRYVVAAMLLLTLAVGAGAGMVEQSSTMNALATDSPAIEKNEYVDTNFSARSENTTTTLIAVRTPDGNVLSKDELVRSLELQRALRANATLNAAPSVSPAQRPIPPAPTTSTSIGGDYAPRPSKGVRCGVRV